MARFIFNIKIAFEALFQNTLRSILTTLGIIFGVASVIAMQAIGKGAQQDLLDQLKLVGVNNIVITQKKEDPDLKKEEKNTNSKKQASMGLSMADGAVLLAEIPEIKQISPEASFSVFSIYNGRGHEAKLKGVSSGFFEMMSMNIEQGHNFSNAQIANADAVCIISKQVQTEFFHGEPPLGKYIKCDKIWLRVIGILEPRTITEQAKKNLNISENPFEIYLPLHTALLRYKDRAFISKGRFNAGNSDDEDEQKKSDLFAYNQVDRITVQVTDSRFTEPVKETIERILKRRHGGAHDFEISVPELLLKQEQHTKDIFNLVLGIIAGISLLVGGIGVMNIMLVSVTERIKEIGLRQALGARKYDITQQFMAEAVMLCSGGGILGVILGIVTSKIISGYFNIPTIFTFLSLIIAFAFSVGVGLIFGIAPARRAAKQDPIESLRYE